VTGVPVLPADTREPVGRAAAPTAGREFSLARLACYLSRPSVALEIHPPSPWLDAPAAAPVPTWPAPTADPQRFGPEFRAAVRRSAGDADTVAVLFSGGLDSAAVLHALATAPDSADRRIVAITVDQLADDGTRTALAASTLLSHFGIDCDHYLVDGDQESWNGLAAPVWNPVRPRLDPAPAVLDQVTAVAAAAGATVLLTGDGADELLDTPKFLLPVLLGSRRPGAAARYLARTALEGGWQAVGAELLSLSAPVLPRRTSASLGWSVLWPELCDPSPAIALSEPYAGQVTAWTVAWLRGLLDGQLPARSWAAAESWLAVLPNRDLPARRGDGVTWRTPYLDPAFLDYAVRLPLASRYDDRHSSGYHRGKALVTSLFPTDLRRVLPHAKYRYSHSMGGYLATMPLRAERCIAHGLLDPAALDAPVDKHVRAAVAAIEQWLAGAEAAGAVPVSVPVAAGVTG
jgi:asparagine synthase (glutamine-hydrolysing)